MSAMPGGITDIMHHLSPRGLMISAILFSVKMVCTLTCDVIPDPCLVTGVVDMFSWIPLLVVFVINVVFRLSKIV